MNSENTKWLRVSRSRPCPVCKRPDWCLVAPDGSAAICARTESDRRCGEAGYLHKLRDTGATYRRVQRTRTVAASIPAPAFTELSERYRRAAIPTMIERFALQLGVSTESLIRLAVGWDGESWTFPMRNPAGNIVGIRRRLPNGRKLAAKGGKEGLFIPADLPASGLLLVSEGPTDTAALLTLGFAVIGRPSCLGGVRYCCELARGRPAVVVADADDPGRRGAEALANTLRVYCLDVRVIVPPFASKDARDWVRSGARAADVQAAIAQAEAVRFSVKAVHRV